MVDKYQARNGETGYVGGIPAIFFDPKYDGPFELPGKFSKKLIVCSRGINSITLRPKDKNDDYLLHAQVDPFGVLELSIRSQNEQGKYSDFFANEFIKEVFVYYKKLGVEIKSVKSNWPSWDASMSDNYKSFESSLAKRGVHDLYSQDDLNTQEMQEILASAAKDTWSYKTMSILGYSIIDTIRINKLRNGKLLVNVYMSREKEETTKVNKKGKNIISRAFSFFSKDRE